MKPPRTIPPRNPLATRCWNCGYKCDSVHHIASDGWRLLAPDDGDISVCLKCHAPALFDRTMPDGVRKPSPREMDDIEEAIQCLKNTKQSATQGSKKA